jgi:hypothetical protein
MKKQIKRWNELAGTQEDVINENEQRLTDQDLYGNSFLQERLNENLGEKLKQAQEEKGEGEGEDESDLNDEDKATVSDSSLAKSLKTGAASLAKAIPSVMNDEFADIVNSVKDIMGDKQKVNKLLKYIEKLGNQ